MRVLLDTNVIIRILLSRSPQHPLPKILDAALHQRITLIASETALREIRDVIPSKQFLAGRIATHDIDDLITTFAELNAIVPAPPPPIPAVLRDPKDDFLIATALAHKVDILCSGDKDLLVHHRSEPFAIVSPGDLVALLETLAIHDDQSST